LYFSPLAFDFWTKPYKSNENRELIGGGKSGFFCSCWGKENMVFVSGGGSFFNKGKTPPNMGFFYSAINKLRPSLSPSLGSDPPILKMIPPPPFLGSSDPS
jgi:hypothetical protein